jgi:hypothetical protein
MRPDMNAAIFDVSMENEVSCHNIKITRIKKRRTTKHEKIKGGAHRGPREPVVTNSDRLRGYVISSSAVGIAANQKEENRLDLMLLQT